MKMATAVLITFAAFGFGVLIGSSLTGEVPASEITATAAQSPAEAPAQAVKVEMASVTGGAPVFRYLSPGDVEMPEAGLGPAEPAVSGENLIRREGAWKSETMEVSLAGNSAIEYKVVMGQGDAIVYRWSADGAQVYYDFHAHDSAFGDEFFTRYAEGEGSDDAGSIIAPYAGQHGWYWLNLETNPVTVTLEVAGFYDSIIELGLEGY